MYNSNKTQAMTNDELLIKAPSVFAEGKHEGCSDKYKFIPTIHVVDQLRAEGWMPVWASESRVRDKSKEGFQKHMLRFRKEDKSLEVGDSIIETVLVNSHDRSCAYQLHAGVFRLVCSNGMVVADATFGKVSTKHVGFDPREVIEASYKVIEDAPQIADSIGGMREVQLVEREQLALAESALHLKYDELKDSPVDPRQLLSTRRWDDKGNDLWTTFNRIQENMLRGGLRGRTSNNRRTRTREVKSIDKNVKLNKALWHLAEEMKNLKIGA